MTFRQDMTAQKQSFSQIFQLNNSSQEQQQPNNILSIDFITKIMKYTSPFKPANHFPNDSQNTFQNSPPKDSPFLHNSWNSNLQKFQSKSNQISYFQNSKYKVTERHHQSPRKSRIKEKLSSPADRFGKIGKLLENITNKHQEMKNKLTHLKQNAPKYQQNGEQCTFSPQIKHNRRYIIPSSLEERTKEWGQSKARHYTSIKQELVTGQVKQCTFTPKLISKSQNTKILKEKAQQQKRIKQKKEEEEYSKDKNVTLLKNNEQKSLNRNEQKRLKNETNRIQYSLKDIKKIKELIKYEVSRIKFDY